MSSLARLSIKNFIKGTLTLVLFLPSLTKAKALLISDVDDTIKVVRTGNPLETAINAFDEYWAYPRMSQKYTEILTSLADSEIVYLTNAPSRYLARTHLNFLRNNSFPHGEYLPRPDDVSTEIFKFHTINQLIKAKKPDILILIGDNVERDPIIYALTEELHSKNIKIKTFIRALPFGTTPLQKKQIPFITSEDLHLEKLQ